ncbi:MAG: hypothetical protein FJ022_08400 [Chloroflexi bacterium]|nr:hypothetical protein [Chloroflexota bacterium]MBM3173800.1 hypothetical protein [Chloroflexota bacterium]MBM4450793.1 hypothetical protein [Chloroflexota bacterium]MBM4454555.1 hypothetical protein [Chloroflexota bacterium]
MAITDHIERVRDGIRRGLFTSEAAVSQGILLPILSELGWPVYDPTIVTPEYSIEGRRVDYALCHPENSPAVFVEVKKVGLSESAERQLFEYAFHVGVPMAILTDGQEWSFYLPGEQGRYDERRVYKIDLLTRSTIEASERLIRYLSFERVCSGKALQDARSDYQNVARDRTIKATFPKAWNALLVGQDSLLLELLADKVEDFCGYKPDLDTCSQFFENMLRAEQTLVSDQPPTPKQGRKTIPPRIILGDTRSMGHFTFEFRGNRYTARSARDVMVKVFQLFAKEDNEFLDRFAARKHGRKRRYIAKERSELYPDRPDLVEFHSIELVPGWWMGTNYSRKNIQEIINLACEVAGPRLGSMVQVKVDQGC